jgi:hypothetical protein
MKVRTETNKIILHHTLTTCDVGVKQIREWHKARGWDDIGYHYVIRKDGSIEEGRELKYEGAHAKGRNADSIGIALAGDFSKQIPLPAQLEALDALISSLSILYDLGVYDYGVGFYDIVQYHRTGVNACPGKLFIKIFEDDER